MINGGLCKIANENTIASAFANKSRKELSMANLTIGDYGATIGGTYTFEEFKNLGKAMVALVMSLEDSIQNASSECSTNNASASGHTSGEPINEPATSEPEKTS